MTRPIRQDWTAADHDIASDSSIVVYTYPWSGSVTVPFIEYDELDDVDDIDDDILDERDEEEMVDVDIEDGVEDEMEVVVETELDRLLCDVVAEVPVDAIEVFSSVSLFL